MCTALLFTEVASLPYHRYWTFDYLISLYTYGIAVCWYQSGFLNSNLLASEHTHKARARTLNKINGIFVISFTDMSLFEVHATYTNRCINVCELHLHYKYIIWHPAISEIKFAISDDKRQPQYVKEKDTN